MNIRDLVYLVACAKYKHFGRAARACHVSQPALSAQIKKLEDELGVRVFERNNKQVVVTVAGEAIVRKAQAILNQVDDLKHYAQVLQDPLSGVFRLGVIPTVGPYLLPLVLGEIKAAMPRLTLAIVEAQTQRCLAQLQAGELDAAVLALPIEGSHLQHQTLYTEPFYVAMPLAHPLARKSRISQEDLVDEAVMLLADGHCLRDQALAVCRNSGAHEDQTLLATSLETLRYMVSLGSGITLLPHLATQGIYAKQVDIAVRAFVEPQPTRQIALVWRDISVRHVVAEKIATLISATVALP